MREDVRGPVPVAVALVALIGTLLVGPARAGQGEAGAGSSRPALADILISFKLDPRLTRAQYMGDRWVSKRSFTSTVQPGETCRVDVTVQGVDARGNPLKISPAWNPGDPDLVTVTPARGASVGITALGPGETDLEVTAEGFTKRLSIRATALYDGTAMQMEISQ